MRMEPPPSVPMASGPRPAATAALAPPLEPPGVRSRFHGLRVTPKRRLCVAPIQPIVGVFVLPSWIAPAASHPLHHRRGLGRDVVGVEARAEGRPDALGEDEVLGGERDTVQRPEPGAALRQRALGRARVAHRLLGRQRHEGVERRVQALDAPEHGLHHLHRRDLLPPDGGGHLRGRHPAQLIRSHVYLLPRRRWVRRREGAGPGCRGGHRRADSSRTPRG